MLGEGAVESCAGEEGRAAGESAAGCGAGVAGREEKVRRSESSCSEKSSTERASGEVPIRSSEGSGLLMRGSEWWNGQTRGRTRLLGWGVCALRRAAATARGTPRARRDPHQSWIIIDDSHSHSLASTSSRKEPRTASCLVDAARLPHCDAPAGETGEVLGDVGRCGQAAALRRACCGGGAASLRLSSLARRLFLVHQEGELVGLPSG